MLTELACRVTAAAGDESNDASDGKPAGHNTDGFDISANNVVVEDSVVMNQGRISFPDRQAN